MTKTQAITQLAALHIPYMEDGTTVEATYRSMHDANFASYLPRRDQILVCAEPEKIAALKDLGWETGRETASMNHFERE